MGKSGKFASATAAALFLAAVLGTAARPSEPSQGAAIPRITGTMLKMQNPKYSAGMLNGRHYEVTAASATQMLDRADAMELDQPRVQLGFANGAVLGLSGTTGVLRVAAGSLSLAGDVILTTGSGRSISLKDAAVDLRDNTLTSATAIVTNLKNDLIRAHHLEVTDEGDIILVYGAIVRPEGVVFFDRYRLD